MWHIGQDDDPSWLRVQMQRSEERTLAHNNRLWFSLCEILYRLYYLLYDYFVFIKRLLFHFKIWLFFFYYLLFHVTVNLSEGLSLEALQPILSNSEFVQKLKEYLPSGTPTGSIDDAEAIRSTIHSPQFQQVVSFFYC